jgi:hypothetical protein
MASAYLVESHFSSPVYITYPKPVAVFLDRKSAVNFAKEKNQKSVRNQYFVTRVDLFAKDPS